MAIFLNPCFILINMKSYFLSPSPQDPILIHKRFVQLHFWVVHIVKQYICFLFQITKLYIGYAFQTTESVVFLFENHCSWFSSGKRANCVLMICDPLSFSPFPSPSSFSSWIVHSYSLWGRVGREGSTVNKVWAHLEVQPGEGCWEPKQKWGSQLAKGYDIPCVGMACCGVPDPK